MVIRAIFTALISCILVWPAWDQEFTVGPEDIRAGEPDYSPYVGAPPLAATR